MRSTLDIIDIIWQVLNSSSLKTAITGGLYKGNRPLNSKLIDVTINSLPIMGTQLQLGYANVNIHVPNLVTGGSQQDNTLPDHLTLKTLTNLAIQILNDVVTESGDVSISIEFQHTFSEPEISQHYSNIRLQVYAVNV